MDTGGAITVVAAITTVGATVATMAGTGAITTVGGIITAIGGEDRGRIKSAASLYRLTLPPRPLLETEERPKRQAQASSARFRSSNVMELHALNRGGVASQIEGHVRIVSGGPIIHVFPREIPDEHWV
ncbi:hypothetical protein HU230_0029715 [Bradyrhizobium quebecense]|uniref:hypothetical protein n=1 Tax=Bradyrhizobium quebecense TaxID=2748629 RepID=UPI001CD26D6F|nr:hypothetical protein [Bradyrhizobium quebecense]UGA42446.1 hypothetical protein HU230_0029715 [Bradyrhizobium quebecense]